MLKSGLKKICRNCGKELSVKEFWKNKQHKDRLNSYCKECERKRAKEYNKNPFTKYKKWASQLKRNFNLTPEEYEYLLKKQNGVCAICKKAERRKRNGKVHRLSVDHNHKTGFIRGLLCNYCNRRILMYLRDNKNRAEGLVKYLRDALKNDKDWKLEETK